MDSSNLRSRILHKNRALNQNLTTRYNAETKYWQYKYNGVWYNDHYVDPTFDGNVFSKLSVGDYVTLTYGRAQGASILTNTSSQFKMRVGTTADSIKGTYLVICTMPVYISDTTKVSYNYTVTQWQNTHTMGGIVITDTLEVPDVGETTEITSSPHVCSIGSSASGNNTVSNVGLKSSVTSKFSDFTKPYYVGIYIRESWTNGYGQIQVDNLSIQLP